MLARSRASITAGEQTATATTMPSPAEIRPVSRQRETRNSRPISTPSAKVSDWSRPSQRSSSHTRG
jgi:hypothetical protein